MRNIMAMHEQSALKVAIVKWAEKVGVKTAVTVLAMELDISISTAEKMCTGRYPATIRPKLEAKLSSRLVKSGFLPARRKAA